MCVLVCVLQWYTGVRVYVCVYIATVDMCVCVYRNSALLYI